ncbi:MAG TPA: NADH dehydrogenase (quinone) subunit D [Blastocatellia bacterium]|jgi:NADH dehydrogenase I D subunit|nr:NADH dehydrogenase (quinone) subunit D [Blastocatellia bacterium]
MGIESTIGDNIITTKISDLANWARKSSLWPMPFGTACCAIEFMSVVSAHYDLARYGAEVVRFSPRQSDLMMVMGTITDKMVPVLKRIYEQMPDPKWVISMGACATSGGFYRAYHVVQGIDEFLPVDVYIPGCPPTPEAVLQAILMIQNVIKKETFIDADAREELRARMRKEITESAPKPLLIAEQQAREAVRLVQITREPAAPKNPIVGAIEGKFKDQILDVNDFRGDLAITIRPDRVTDICRTLKEDPATKFDLLSSVTGLDYLGHPDKRRDERFNVVYHMYSIDHGHRVRLKVPLPEKTPEVDSVTPVWKTANWWERETYDMFGIGFRNHPDLRRILCHEEFVGHALRKDHDPGGRTPLSRDYKLPIEYKTRWEGHETDRLSPEPAIINVGPSHPATHGTLRIVARLDGEQIVESDVEIGYLHRCFEKMSETHQWNQVIPYTDRLNYMSSFLNNVGYACAVEKLLGIEVPKRVQYIRVILGELSRIMDHMVCIGANLVDLGAITNFWYSFEPREEIYDLLEMTAGVRMMVSYVRVGGLQSELPQDFVPRCREVLTRLPKYIDDIAKLNTNNRIFKNRAVDVTPVSAKEAIDWGFTGPMLRAAGVPYDIRQNHPYSSYEDFDFEVPVGNKGDLYDRYLVRMEEMRQSIRIVTQALENLPEGPYQVDDRRITLPPKKGVYTNIEDLMNHFKLQMHGIQVPPGEVYGYSEAGNGELGFYIVSDGSMRPWRIHCRGACFPIFSAFPALVEGHLLADAVAALGSFNIVAGELDR